jgi:hypothetical protein
MLVFSDKTPRGLKNERWTSSLSIRLNLTNLSGNDAGRSLQTIAAAVCED